VEICVAGRRLSARTDMPRRGIPAPVDEQQQLATARSAGGDLRRRRAAPEQAGMPRPGSARRPSMSSSASHSQERGWRSASLVAGSRTEPACRGGGSRRPSMSSSNWPQPRAWWRSALLAAGSGTGRQEAGKRPAPADELKQLT
jgi:hypothetical protein